MNARGIPWVSIVLTLDLTWMGRVPAHCVASTRYVVPFGGTPILTGRGYPGQDRGYPILPPVLTWYDGTSHPDLEPDLDRGESHSTEGLPL